MKYFIAHLLSGEAKKYHEALTRALADRFGVVALHERVPPHLTLKVPFEADDDGIKDIERILRSFARIRRATPLLLRGFGHFGFRTIYLDTEKSAEATALARGVLQALRENAPALPRPPHEGNKLHASVARFLSRKQFSRIWRILSNMRPRFESSFDNIAILKRTERAWTVHAVIPLQSADKDGLELPLHALRHEDEALVP